MSYLIPVENVAKLNEDFAALVKKAAKVGAELPTMTWGAKVVKEIKNTNTNDVDTGKKVITWLKGKSGTEFFDNLNAFAGAEHVSHKAFGYLAAGAMMYLKDVEALKVFQSKKDGVVSEPIAPEGTKVKVKATVVTAARFERQAYHYGDSGVSQVLMMKTDEGKLVKMFTANCAIKVNDTVEISGRIGKTETETFERSPFKGLLVTQMAPRSRITL